MFAAIFDLDGTLVDTADDLMLAGNNLYEELEWDLRLDPNFDTGIAIGGGRSMIIYGLKSQGIPVNKNVVDKLYPLLLKHYDKTIDKNSFIYPGIRGVLEELKENSNWEIGLCTNKPEAQAQELLSRLGIRSFFKSFVGADTVGVAKPSPIPLIAAIKLLGADQRRSVLIGDTETDRVTASNANVKSLIVRYGHGKFVSDLDKLNPDALVDTPWQIVEVLNTLVSS